MCNYESACKCSYNGHCRHRVRGVCPYARIVLRASRSRGGLQAHNALGNLNTHVKSVNTFSTNDDPKEVMKNIIIITSFKHWLIIIVKNVKIQSQLVGQSLVPDMSLMIRYSLPLVGQSITIDVCDSTGNLFV